MFRCLNTGALLDSATARLDRFVVHRADVSLQHVSFLPELCRILPSFCARSLPLLSSIFMFLPRHGKPYLYFHFGCSAAVPLRCM